MAAPFTRARACRKSERRLEAGPRRAGLPGRGLPSCCPFLKQTSGRGLGSGAELGGSAAIASCSALLGRRLWPGTFPPHSSAGDTLQTPRLPSMPRAVHVLRTLTAICPHGFSGDACGEGAPQADVCPGPAPGLHSLPRRRPSRSSPARAALPVPTWLLTSGPPFPLTRPHMDSGVCPASWPPASAHPAAHEAPPRLPDVAVHELPRLPDGEHSAPCFPIQRRLLPRWRRAV